MNVIELLQPVLDGGLERNNFFNGRLLSAQDLRAEQDATRVQTGRLARAIGDGVAWGLSVTLKFRGPGRPLVTVSGGVALNRLGNSLVLANAVDVAIVKSLPAASSDSTQLFAVCEELPSSSVLSGLGAYLLAIAPESGFRGTAVVSDPNTTEAGRGACGARFSVEGVKFRLVPIEIDALQGIGADLRSRLAALLPPLSDPRRERLRNLLAHSCLGSPAAGGEIADALALQTGAPGGTGWGIVDAMRRRASLTDCDVPLAVLVLESDGISFVDMWSVRRRLIDAGAIAEWQGVASPRRMAEGEAAFLQFQAQLAGVKTLGSSKTAVASTYFDVLPAAGWLPVDATGFSWTTFLGPHAPPHVTPVDAALLRGIIERSWFDEAFAVATNPPVPLRVYEVPGQGSQSAFVVFARSSLGAIRVSLTPVPPGSHQVEVTATAKTGIAQRSTTRNGGTVIVPELTPGPHTVTITAPGYLAVQPSEAAVVGGRTVDLGVALTPIPNGSIRIEPVDEGGRNVAERVTTITATAGAATYSAVKHDQKFVLFDLPNGTYSLTGSATGYTVAVRPNVGPVTAGQQFDTTLVFEPAETGKKPPPRCVEVKKPKKPLTRRSRLCLVLKGTEFNQKYFYEHAERLIAKDERHLEMFAMRSRERGERAKGRYANEYGMLVFREEPWDDMLPIDLDAGVNAWLLKWRAWFADLLQDDVIRKQEPQLYFERSYAVSKGHQDVPKTPVGYAVFAWLGVPVRVTPYDGATKAPVPLDKAKLSIGARERRLLRRADFEYLDEVAWAWTELLADALGEPEKDLAFLIEEAIERAAVINKEFGYYDDVDVGEGKMRAAGYGDDVAIANADVEKLSKVVESKYIAARTIRKAREIVPIDSWSLVELGIPLPQIEGLHAIGIDSMGALMAQAGTSPGKAAVAQVLGLTGQPAAARDEALATVTNAAAALMVKGSLTVATPLSVANWDKVDATTANKLSRAGYDSVDDLAAAEPAAVAAALEVTEAEATTLVDNAKVGGRATTPLTRVASISKSEEQKLTALLGAEATAGALAGKTAADIAEAFGGNEARATAVLTGIRAGLLRGVIR